MERSDKKIMFLLYYYLIINLIVFVIMFLDKKRAVQNKWRVSEKIFFILSFLGGFLGEITAMYTLHHKNKKLKFYFVFVSALLLHSYFLYKLIKI